MLLLLILVTRQTTAGQAPASGLPGGAGASPITLQMLGGAELMIQFRGLDRQFQSPQGLGLRAVLDGLGLFSRTEASWNALGSVLGLGPDEAVDALLGGRFLLLADRIDEAHETRWACVMTTDGISDLPKRLKAAPRGTASGRTVYAIEDGRLAVMPLDTEGGRLAVAPRGAESLLRTAAQLATNWPDRKANAEPGGVFFVDRPDGVLVSGTVRLSKAGWDIDFSFDQSRGAANRDFAPPTRVENAWYERVSAGCGIAYAGPIGDAEAGAQTVPGLMSTDFQTLRRWTQVFLPFPGQFPFLAQGEADYGILTAGAEHQGAAWLRVPDAARAAKAGDAYVCDLLGTLAGSGHVSPESPECTGRFPNAGRRVALSGQGADPSGGLSFAWGVVSLQSAGTLATAQHWWSVHALSSEKTPRPHTTLAPGLSGKPDQPTARFTLRPALLLERVAPALGLGRLVPQTGTPPPASGEADRGAPFGGPGLDLSALARISLVDCAWYGPETPENPTTGRIRLRFGAP